MNHKIELRNGAIRFNENTVFSDVHIALNPGNYYTLTGPNGSGKSTLMSCFLRQLALSSGEILLNGQPVSARTADYVEQVFGINDSIGWLPGLTVGQHLEMLAHNTAHLNNSLKTPLLSAREALKELGVAQAYDRQPYTLSSGQEQRSRLASLLVRPALYYFLDEPEKRLDTEGVHWIAQWSQDRVDEGAMVCIATHDETLNSLPETYNLTFPLTGSSQHSAAGEDNA